MNDPEFGYESEYAIFFVSLNSQDPFLPVLDLRSDDKVSSSTLRDFYAFGFRFLNDCFLNPFKIQSLRCALNGKFISWALLYFET